MAFYGNHPPLSLAEDPSDPVWHWFICNGPHGERFKWEKPSYAERDLYYLKKFIEEQTALSNDFFEKLRIVSLKSLRMENIVMVRTAIQVLCVVGNYDDLSLIIDFVNDENETIRKDARACLFERGIKYKRNNKSY